MKRSQLLAAVATAMVLGLFCAPAGAELVVADFNDLSGTTPFDLKGQGGGTGFDGTWGTANEGTRIKVVGGDLTSSNYTLTQSGTPLSAGGNALTGSYPHESRDLVSDMTGDIWFTFLMKKTAATSRIGISLNDEGEAATQNRILFVNNDLYVQLAGNVLIDTNNLVTYGQTYLILGQLTPNVSGSNDELKLWYNPVLTSIDEIADLPAPTLSNSDYDFLAADGYSGSALQRIGIVSYSGADGVVDAIRISNRSTAFQDVTGQVVIPEPGTLALLATAMLGLLAHAWRKRK